MFEMDGFHCCTLLDLLLCSFIEQHLHGFTPGKKTIPMSAKLIYFRSLSVRGTTLLTSQYSPSTLDLDLIISLLPHASSCATWC